MVNSIVYKSQLTKQKEGEQEPSKLYDKGSNLNGSTSLGFYYFNCMCVHVGMLMRMQMPTEARGVRSPLELELVTGCELPDMMRGAELQHEHWEFYHWALSPVPVFLLLTFSSSPFDHCAESDGILCMGSHSLFLFRWKVSFFVSILREKGGL